MMYSGTLGILNVSTKVSGDEYPLMPPTRIMCNYHFLIRELTVMLSSDSFQRMQHHHTSAGVTGAVGLQLDMKIPKHVGVQKAPHLLSFLSFHQDSGIMQFLN